MAYFINVLFCILLFIINPVPGAEICNLGDVSCTTRLASSQYSTLIKGIGNAVATSDPLSRDEIKGYLPTVKYFFYNATFKGLKHCLVKKLQIIQREKVFQYNLECPQIAVNAIYKLKGKVGKFSVKGEGPAHVVCDDYLLHFECDYEKNVGKDNKEHIHITNYFIEVVPRGNVLLDFQNISAGDKEKTEEFHKFVNQNWKELDKELRAPAINSFMDLFIENVNDFLATISVEQLLADITLEKVA